MAISLLAANNAQSVLAAGIGAAATTLTVNTGTGVLFPSPVSGTSFFKLTLIDAATGTLTEIVHVTQRVGDQMTIERGQEGTVARIWSANDLVANMMTAGTLSYLKQDIGGKLAITGTAAAATKLATARTINGVAFDGSADITLPLALPVGSPVPYPLSEAPEGWLKCNGKTFNKTTYPVLASIYPTGKLPDLRGEFIRGWDDGRKVDTGRALLSSQGDAIRNITANRNGVAEWTSGEDIGAFSTVFNHEAQLGEGTGFCQWGSLIFDASKVVPRAAENRPRNIAFNYIVRAE